MDEEKYELPRVIKRMDRKYYDEVLEMTRSSVRGIGSWSSAKIGESRKTWGRNKRLSGYLSEGFKGEDNPMSHEFMGWIVEPREGQPTYDLEFDDIMNSWREKVVDYWQIRGESSLGFDIVHLIREGEEFRSDLSYTLDDDGKVIKRSGDEITKIEYEDFKREMQGHLERYCEKGKKGEKGEKGSEGEKGGEER